MCSVCATLGMPVCATSAICSANLPQLIQLLLVSSGATAGSILVWLKDFKKV